MKILYFILAVFTVYFFISCSSDTPNGVIKKSEQNHLIIAKPNFRWKMVNQNGDTAFFQSGDTLLLSFANLFWDTAKVNRFEIKAIPIQFVYWEQNIKKRMYFALGVTDTGYVFASTHSPIISDYSLDGFYLKYFFIPNVMNDNGFVENHSANMQVADKNYKLSTVAEWNNIGKETWKTKQLTVWKVRYTALNETKNPQTYINDFQFIDSVGFYKFMDYILVDTCSM